MNKRSENMKRKTTINNNNESTRNKIIMCRSITPLSFDQFFNKQIKCFWNNILKQNFMSLFKHELKKIY